MISFKTFSVIVRYRNTGLDKNLFLSSISRPWLKSQYLKRRLDQLGGLFYELNPHIPVRVKIHVIIILSWFNNNSSLLNCILANQPTYDLWMQL